MDRKGWSESTLTAKWWGTCIKEGSQQSEHRVDRAAALQNCFHLCDTAATCTVLICVCTVGWGTVSCGQNQLYRSFWAWTWVVWTNTLRTFEGFSKRDFCHWQHVKINTGLCRKSQKNDSFYWRRWSLHLGLRIPWEHHLLMYQTNPVLYRHIDWEQL